MLPNDAQTAGDDGSEDTSTSAGSTGTTTASEGAGEGKKAGRSDDTKQSAEEIRVLRLEQRLDQLVNILLTQDQDDDGEERVPERTSKSLRDLAPSSGYEGAKDFFDGVVQSIDDLRQEVKQTAKAREAPNPDGEFKLFKRLNKGWEKYDGTMAQICKTFGMRPQSLEQFESLREIAESIQDKPRLKAELEAAKKGGAVPRMSPPTPGLRERLRTAGQTRKSNGASLSELVEQGVNRARTAGHYDEP